MTNFFESGTALVGAKEIEFSRRTIRDNYTMFVPAEFLEDRKLISNYTYLFSKDKSPLSLAIKFSSASSPVDKDKLVAHYFDSPADSLERDDFDDLHLLYRETVTSNQYFSVYSLRFSLESKGGLLFGCFNCSAEYKEDWRPVVLQMLKSLERAKTA